MSTVIYQHDDTPLDHSAVSSISEQLKCGSSAKYLFANGDILTIQRVLRKAFGAGEVPCIEVAHGTLLDPRSDDGSTHKFGFEDYFSPSETALAASAFVMRVLSSDPTQPTRLGSFPQGIAAKLAVEQPLPQAKQNLIAALAEVQAEKPASAAEVVILQDIISSINRLIAARTPVSDDEDLRIQVNRIAVSEGRIAALKYYQSQTGSSVTASALAVTALLNEQSVA